MIFQMADESGKQEIIQVDSYHMKYYEPSRCLQKYTYMLIRPPRLLYNQDLLHPNKSYGRRYQHTVFCIPFPLSLYQPKDMHYVILYLHGNSSSRLQGYQQLSNLPQHVGLACFDFDGCGNRLQKKYISLGKDESKEVDIAAAFLKEKGYKVVGWGRSMGSVSLLLSSECQVVVADSPFQSLKSLCYERVMHQAPYLCRPILYCLLPCLLGCVECDFHSKTEVSFSDLEVGDKINVTNNRSVLFLAASEDTLIDYKHSQRLYQRYEGRKKIIVFEGDHHSDRPISVLATSYVWIESELEQLQTQLSIQSKKEVSDRLRGKGHSKSLSQMALFIDYQQLQSISNSQSLQRLTQDKIAVQSMQEKVESVDAYSHKQSSS